MIQKSLKYCIHILGFLVCLWKSVDQRKIYLGLHALQNDVFSYWQLYYYFFELRGNRKIQNFEINLWQLLNSEFKSIPVITTSFASIKNKEILTVCHTTNVTFFIITLVNYMFILQCEQTVIIPRKDFWHPSKPLQMRAKNMLENIPDSL